MGTLPAQRGRENAGFGLQGGGSRWDRAHANEAPLNRELSIPVYRRHNQDQNGSETQAWENRDCMVRLERKLVKLGETFLAVLGTALGSRSRSNCYRAFHGLEPASPAKSWTIIYRSQCKRPRTLRRSATSLVM
jgi:hypothetical protein